MTIYRRSLLYLRRKKGRAMLLFGLFWVISILLMLCVNILFGSEETAGKLRTELGAVLYIRPYGEKKMADGVMTDISTPQISEESVEEILRSCGSEIKDYNVEHSGYVKSEDIQFFSGMADNEESLMGKLVGVRNSQLSEDFLSGRLKLCAGNPVQAGDKNSVLISRELAEKNHLKVGDKLRLTHAEIDEKDGRYTDSIPEKTIFCEVWIAGIYEITAGEDNPSLPAAGMPENRIYAADCVLVSLKEQREGIYEGEVTLLIKDPVRLEAVKEKIQEIGSIDWENHILRENDFQYKKISGQLKGIQTSARILLFFGAAAGVGVLMLSLLLQLRGRTAEAGILLALGRTKTEIALQFDLEILIVLSAGYLAAAAVMGLLEGTVNTALFGGLLENSGIKAPYIQLKFWQCLLIFAGEAAAALSAAFVCSRTVLRLKPKEILTKMS